MRSLQDENLEGADTNDAQVDVGRCLALTPTLVLYYPNHQPTGSFLRVQEGLVDEDEGRDGLLLPSRLLLGDLGLEKDHQLDSQVSLKHELVVEIFQSLAVLVRVFRIWTLISIIPL